jgi:DNA-binding LytR/AlgR family response regulator
MKIKIHIVEDEVLVAEDTASDLEKAGFVVNGISISGQEVLDAIQNDPPHLILMDINIKGDMDGIQTAEKLNDLGDFPIIYVTSNTTSQFVNRALETKPHAFITKPYNLNDLVIAIELAMKKHNEMAIESTYEMESIFVKSGDFYRKIAIDDVTHIEADGSYCKVFSKDDKYTLSFNLNHFQKEVKANDLIRVHRSYVVNRKHVDGFDRASLLIGKQIIPVSSTYRDTVFEQFKRL